MKFEEFAGEDAVEEAGESDSDVYEVSGSGSVCVPIEANLGSVWISMSF